MKPKILVTREVFDETLAYLAGHCEVESNQPDQPLEPAALAQRLKDKDGVVCCLTDRIDDAVLAAAPRLKVVANIAVGYNNIDVPACTARGVMATNTPGVLDDSTADLAWTLMLATARRLPSNGQTALAKGGGLMSYNINQEALFRRAAHHIDRILRGAKPADLPIEQPTTFELILNQKAAQALGIKFPQSLLVRADEVIE